MVRAGPRITSYVGPGRPSTSEPSPDDMTSFSVLERGALVVIRGYAGVRTLHGSSLHQDIPRWRDRDQPTHTETSPFTQTSPLTHRPAHSHTDHSHRDQPTHTQTSPLTHRPLTQRPAHSHIDQPTHTQTTHTQTTHTQTTHTQTSPLTHRPAYSHTDHSHTDHSHIDQPTHT